MNARRVVVEFTRPRIEVWLDDGAVVRLDRQTPRALDSREAPAATKGATRGSVSVYI